MEKFYQKTWFCVLMLFLFFPIGLILMWRYKKFGETARIIITGLFILALCSSNSTLSVMVVVGTIAAIFLCKKNKKMDAENKESKELDTEREVAIPYLVNMPDYKTNPQYAELEKQAREALDAVGNTLVVLIKDNLNVPFKLKSVKSRNGYNADDFLKEIEICLQANFISDANVIYDFLKQNEKGIKAAYKKSNWDYEILEPYGDCITVLLRDSERMVQESILNMDYMGGSRFEYFCADILKKKGYENVEVTKGSGDQGVDIIAERDGIRYAIQCKCYSSTVGNKAVQEVYAGKDFYRCQIGVVMTNNYFTKSAIELAESNGTILWDRDSLNMFMKTYSSEIQDTESDLIVSNDGSEDFPSEEAQEEKEIERESNIYPEGNYIVGTDLPLGRYLIKAKSETNGSIEMFENYGEFKKDNSFMFRSFSKEFFITLLEEGEYITVEDAIIHKL